MSRHKKLKFKLGPPCHRDGVSPSAYDAATTDAKKAAETGDQNGRITTDGKCKKVVRYPNTVSPIPGICKF